MALVQVKDAEGLVLDWMVAKCKGTPAVRMFENSKGFRVYENESMKMQGINFAPSTNWSQGGPIIDREIGNLWKHNKLDPNEPDVWTAAAYRKAPDGTLLYYEDGPTPLIAAMRCYVSSVLGEEVEVPDELL